MDPMLQAPDATEYRYALYCRSYLWGLTEKPEPPIALYHNREFATAHGHKMWPGTFVVVDLHKDDRP